MLKSIAVNREATGNPGTTELTKSTKNPLITSKNIPSVTIVRGKVRMTRIGFIKVLTTAKTIDTTISEVNVSITTPGII